MRQIRPDYFILYYIRACSSRFVMRLFLSFLAFLKNNECIFVKLKFYHSSPELNFLKWFITRFSYCSTYKKECFFWRTTGCTRDDCTFRHVPEHKNIDRDKFTSRLGLHSAIQKWSRQWEARGVSFDLTPWSWHPLFCLFVCLFVFCFCFLSLFWFTTKKVYFELFIIRFW